MVTYVPSALCDFQQRVMYDLCTRSEQPESAPVHTEMESRNKAEAPGQQQQELRGSGQDDKKQQGLLDKEVPTTANFTTSLLGKRHHSLYANLSSFEVEGIRKVRVQHLLWLLGIIPDSLLVRKCLGLVSTH